MNINVNFLPWRRSRFYRHLRYWGMFVGGVWLILGTLVYEVAVEKVMTLTIIDIQHTAEKQISTQMGIRERQLRERAQQHAVQRKRFAYRKATLAWVQRLSLLAEHLPAQAWLTQMTYRDRVLSLSGLLNRFPALAVLDDELHHVIGFEPGQAGKIERDSEGRWGFDYQLRQRPDDATP